MRRPTWWLILLTLAADVALTEAALFLAGVLRLRIDLGWDLPGAIGLATPPIYAMVAAVWTIMFVVFAAHGVSTTRTAPGEVQRVALTVLISTLVLAGLLYLSYRMMSRLLFIYFCLIDLGLLVCFRLLLRAALWATGYEGRRVILVGDGDMVYDVARSLGRDGGMGLSLVGYVADQSCRGSGASDGFCWLGPIDTLQTVIADRGIDEVVITLSKSQQDRVDAIVSELQALPLRIWVVPDFMRLAMVRAAVENVGGVPLIGLREPAIDETNRLIKRGFDLVMALLLLIVCLPIMCLIALAIRLDSQGPVLFRQERVGENGRRFVIWKFRSMVSDAEKLLPDVIVRFPDGSFQHKRANDPRVTRVGKLLRRTSLDELPQLVNVLKGEMSLVGPRPEMPFVVDGYGPLQRNRLAVPPGMTGWWQINGRSDLPLHWHVEYDLFYIQNYSVLLDVWILIRTVSTIIRGRGAY